MINKEIIRDFLQNKNCVMFLTSLVFMLGVLACFYNFGILFAGILTVVFIIFYCLIFLILKRILFLILVFYSAYFLTFYKIKNYDELVTLTPLNSTFTGRIVSIPNSADKTKLKFFMQIEKVGNKSAEGKTLCYNFRKRRSACKIKHW